MQTMLDIDPDVLKAAKEAATRSGKTPGKILSEWARNAMTSEPEQWDEVRNGVPLLPPSPSNETITVEHVNRLRDAE